MELIKPGINIDFVGKRMIWIGISLTMILISVATLLINGGPNYGVDFVGGTILQVKFNGAVEIDKVKSGLEQLDIKGAAVQRFGLENQNEYLIRTNEPLTTDATFSNRTSKALTGATGKEAEIRRVEMVGPQVGETLREKALLAIFYSFLFLAIYISGRFEMKWVASAFIAGALVGVVYFLSIFKVSIPILILAALLMSLFLYWQLGLRYAMGATVALIHDVIIMVGIFTLVGKEFTLPIVAAVLTLIGFSLNDTIIVFDRIRENLAKNPRRPLGLNINRSINETLSRTILTSGTVMIVLVALFFLGGDIIHDFAFSLIIGVVVGTYSSIYIASPILIMMDKPSAPSGEQAGAVSAAG